MTAPVAPSTAAIESQASAIAGSSLQAQAAVAAYLSTWGDEEEAWYSTDAVREIAGQAARISDAFSTVVARDMDNFIADAIAHLSGRRFRAIGIRKTLGPVGENGVRDGGVTTAGVFGRSADSYRYQQSLLDKQYIADVRAGAELPTELAMPMDSAMNRARRSAQLQTMLAARKQAMATMGTTELVTGYRRVLHAELDQTGSCGLCIAASTRVYRKADLMPMHPGCHCLPVPIVGGKDPGAAINDADLDRFYSESGGTDVEHLRSTRYRVDEHGEIGPVLRPHGSPIRTEEQARKDTNRRRTKTPEQHARTLRSRRDALASAHAKAPRGPGWDTRSDGVAKRIARLDRQIVALGG